MTLLSGDVGAPGSIGYPWATGARRGASRGLWSRPGKAKPTISPYNYPTPSAATPRANNRSSSFSRGSAPRSANIRRGR